MRRGSLFFIALVSAVITFISLNIAFGRPGYYGRYSYFHRYHHYYDRHYDERYEHDNQSKNDSTNNNY